MKEQIEAHKETTANEIKDLKKFTQELTENIVEGILDHIKDSFKDESEGATLSLDFALTRLDYWKDCWQASLEDHTKCLDAQEVVDYCFTTLESELDEIVSSVESHVEDTDETVQGYMDDFTKVATEINNYHTDKPLIVEKFIEKCSDANEYIDLPQDIGEVM